MEATIITSLMWDNVTEINLNIFELPFYGSKIRKVSRCWPASNHLLYKSSFHTNHTWHCIIGFLINAALLNVNFILHYHLFFCKKFIFSNVYISVHAIFECLYIFFFGWKRDHQLSTYATVRSNHRGQSDFSV